jgi:tetratricopeptide (TPR) repeat protein
VLEDEVGVARRAALHRRIAEVLEQDPGGSPPEVLAYHFDRGGDDDKTARYLEQAGDQAQERQAHGAAEGYYREAVAHLADLGRPLDLARVRLKLGTVLHAQARYEAALAVLEPAAGSFQQASDLAGLARALAQIGAGQTAQGAGPELGTLPPPTGITALHALPVP